MNGIVIVDRGQVDCEVLRTLLRLEGYEAMAITSIWGAMEYLDAGSSKVGLAFVEEELLLRTTFLGHLPPPSECRIVALSHQCGLEHRRQLLQLGVGEVLCKPYEREALLGVLCCVR